MVWLVGQVLRKQLGVKCILGLTATATSSTVADIAHRLEISDVDIMVHSMLPSNLQIGVSCEVNKDQVWWWVVLVGIR